MTGGGPAGVAVADAVEVQARAMILQTGVHTHR